MTCASNISSFLSDAYYVYQPDYPRYYTSVQLAQWVSYQSFRSPYYGFVPVSLILTQWGLESGWNSSNNFTYYNNPANQGSGCGFSTCGTYNSGRFAAFCNIPAGVSSYAQLIIQGYQHVAAGYTDAGGDVQNAATVLGQGYRSCCTYDGSFCWGASNTTISSTNPRVWDAGHYNGSGYGPGSDIYRTISFNSCLSDYNYYQSTNPNLAGFSNLW